MVTDATLFLPVVDGSLNYVISGSSYGILFEIKFNDPSVSTVFNSLIDALVLDVNTLVLGVNTLVIDVM